MAEVNTGDGEVKKGKPKKQNLRVDFTPMVDMNMLLITFFMFCTSLSKPQIMDLVLPTKDNKQLTEEEMNKVKDSKAITVLLGKDNKVYYYFGKPDYDNPQSLHQTDYSANGLRAVLLERNAVAANKMNELRRKKMRNEINDQEFKKQGTEIKNDPEGAVVVIKPTDGATYENLVDALDEMQICSVGKYAMVDITDGDIFLIHNLTGEGTVAPK